MFIYVNKDHLVSKPEVAAFIDFYLNEGRPLVAEVGYVPLPDEEYEAELKKVISQWNKNFCRQDQSKDWSTCKQFNIKNS